MTKTAKSFSEILKFNPYHGPDGRFTGPGAATSFTYRPGASVAHDRAIEREKERTKNMTAASGTNSGKGSAIKNDENPVHIRTTYRLGRNTSSGASYMTQSVISASEDENGDLILDYATPSKTDRRHNGNIDYEFDLSCGLYQSSNSSGVNSSVNIDWDKVKTVSGQTYESRSFLKNKGFVWDGQSKRYIKPSRNANSDGGLVIGNSFPNDLSGITRITGNTYAFKEKIKSAGFKWDPGEKAWVKKAFLFSGILKSVKSEPESFDDIVKFNPYHGPDGRFTGPGAATSFTINTRSRLSQGAADKAIEREKERMSSIMPTEAQTRTLKGIESRTRNLKKEQFRVVDRDGNVIMQKQGDSGSVSYKIGEARDNFPGNITIHNHPSGGTFSTADLSDIGYGAKEIRAASPEGTYILRNVNPRSKKGWLDMREDLEKASEGFKTDRQLKKEIREKHEAEFQEKAQPYVKKWEQMKADGADWDSLNAVASQYTKIADEFRDRIQKEVRTAYTGQYHSWYQSNAGTYGLEYQFVPTRTRTRKGYDLMAETIEKAEDAVTLDEKMNNDISEITEEIINDLKSSLPVIPAL